MGDALRDLRTGLPAAAMTPPMDKAVRLADAPRTLDDTAKQIGSLGFMYFFPPWTYRRSVGKEEL